MEKYEYLTGEDLGYKPDIIQKAKFEYSPLGKVFNKGLNESDKKEGLLERLKSIEDKDEEQFKAIKEEGEKQLLILAKKTGQIDDFKNIFFKNKLNPVIKKIYAEIKEQGKKIDYTKLVCIGSHKHQYNFTIFLDLKTFAESLYNSSLPLKDRITRLEYYNPQKEKFRTQKEKTS